MVEGEPLRRPKGAPGRLGRIVPAARRPPYPSHPETRPTPYDDGVPGWVRVDPDDPVRPGGEAGLLLQLAADRCLDGLIPLHKPSRQGPSTPEGGVAPADQEHLPLVDPHRVDRQRGPPDPAVPSAFPRVATHNAGLRVRRHR